MVKKNKLAADTSTKIETNAILNTGYAVSHYLEKYLPENFGKK